MPHSTLITGSSGFIGSHVCALLGVNGDTRIAGLDIAEGALLRRSFRADVRDREQLQGVACAVQPSTVVHLAAKSDVVIPFDGFADLMLINVNGTINVLDVMQPDRMVLASSSAVYGNGSRRTARATWSCVNPLGVYGISKAAAEIACGEWARSAGGVAISLRFGNVIGKRCRGLIAYLVEHALSYPDGDRPAQLRGDGVLVRDYVPVKYAARVIEFATQMNLRRGATAVLNVGTGRGMTNRTVAGLVQEVLRARGLRLAVTFNSAPAPGEARRLVLDMTATSRHMGLTPPTDDEVMEAIEEATLDCLAPAKCGRN
jgi:nucleoside-diphosphate-sugar epimerase